MDNPTDSSRWYHDSVTVFPNIGEVSVRAETDACGLATHNISVPWVDDRLPSPKRPSQTRENADLYCLRFLRRLFDFHGT